MNIWEAYCKPAYYNVYFNVLVAKGMSRDEAEKLKYQFGVYLQRLKGGCFAAELKKCTSPESFRKILTDIFSVRWKDRLKFTEMPMIFDDYLFFLDSMQALHNDYISSEEKQRLIDPYMDYPIAKLTAYEEKYMINGKLVALMNPMLLSILKDFIETERLALKRASSVCQTFYGELLPNMESEDFANLIASTWNVSRVVKKGGKRRQFKIVYPSGEEQLLSTTDAMKRVVEFYGFDVCMNLKVLVRNTPFLSKRIPYGLEKSYEEIEEGKYINIIGNTKDRQKAVATINVLLGKKLKIELV